MTTAHDAAIQPTLTTWTRQEVAKLHELQLLALQTGPLLTFLLVAGVDGSVSIREMKAFAEIAGGADRGEVMTALFQTVEEVRPLLRGLLQAKASKDTLQGALRVADLSLSGPARAAYAGAIRKVARSVAEASGGWFGLLGAKVSKEEQGLLDFIDGILADLNFDGNPVRTAV